MKSISKKILAATAVVVAAGGIYTAFAAYTVVAQTEFAPDGQPIGYVGQPALTKYNVSSGSERMFSIDYNSADWSGDMHSHPVSGTGVISSTDTWTGGAKGQIDGQNWDTGRFIVTRNGTSGVPFRWDNLSGDQKTLLDATTAANDSLTVSPMLNFIRGDTSNQMPTATTFTEGGLNYRYRAHLLGDIIHSTPVYCSPSLCGAGTVFVGANDGMMHAIDSETGAERFAFVPSSLIGRLPRLAAFPYNHTYYVDGRLNLLQFTIDGNSKTLLAGTLGAGGKGLFGLNVTNAVATSESDAATKVLWEITGGSGSFANLGYTYSAPLLLSLSNTPTLVVGNGYYNSGNKKASLFLINAHTGALIREISTTGDDLGSAENPNGLSSPSIWNVNENGTVVTYAFAGDLHGNMWRFNLNDYTVVKIHGTNPAQPITSAPGVMNHPYGGVMVTFVTGRMLLDADKNNTDTHYVYGIWDRPGGNSAILEQTLLPDTYTTVTPSIRVRKMASTLTPNWTGGDRHKGWRMALPIGGERLVGDGAFIRNGIYQFMTTNPAVNTSTKPYGENWWMQINALTGGVYGDDPLFDLDKDGYFTSLDQLSGEVNPVGRHMGGAVRSQLIAMLAGTVQVNHANLDKNDMPVTTVTETVTAGRGVSGGHFDFDFYCNYALAGTYCAQSDSQNVVSAYGRHRSPGGSAPKLGFLHIHEYDDIYDRTGVNMLNPSHRLFRLSRAMGNTVSTSNLVTEKGAVIDDYSKVTPQNNVGVTNDRISPPTVTTTNSTPISVSGYPQVTVDGSIETVVNKVTFTTTETKRWTSDQKSCKNSNNRDRYCIYETRKHWTTTETTTEVTTHPAQGFKILVANQAYSPAVELTIGGEDATPVKAYNYQTQSGLSADSLTIYSMATLRRLQFNLPLDGFQSKDWGTGVVRAGLHPTVPNCVVSTAGDWSGGTNYNSPVRGPDDEWRNGALTIQIVLDTVTDSDIRLNVAGRPELGYVLNNDSIGSKLIAEYTTFWHAPKYFEGDTSSPYPNKGWCMGDANWNKTPLQDNSSDARARTPELGSADPREGTYGTGGSGSGSGSGTTGATKTVVERANADGSTTIIITVVEVRADGSSTVTRTEITVGPDGGIVTGGAVTETGGTSVGAIIVDPTGENSPALRIGRISWRELQR